MTIEQGPTFWSKVKFTLKADFIRLALVAFTLLGFYVYKASYKGEIVGWNLPRFYANASDVLLVEFSDTFRLEADSDGTCQPILRVSEPVRVAKK